MYVLPMYYNDKVENQFVERGPSAIVMCIIDVSESSIIIGRDREGEKNNKKLFVEISSATRARVLFYLTAPMCDVV